jgi:hypothetical protein
MGIAASIAAVATAITELCKFLQTVEGQQTLKDIRENNKAVVAWFENTGKQIEAAFK